MAVSDKDRKTAPKINLVLTNGGRVRVTRKVLAPEVMPEPTPEPAPEPPPAPAARPEAAPEPFFGPIPAPGPDWLITGPSASQLRAARSDEDAQFESLDLTDFRRMEAAPLSDLTPGDLAASDLAPSGPVPSDPADIEPDAAEETIEPSPPATEDSDSGPDSLVALSLPVSCLYSSGLRARVPYDRRTVAALAEAMTAKGWSQPILVREHPVIAEAFEIVVGELPFQAALSAGLEELPVAVCGLSDYRALECVLLEDVQRGDLAPLEIAVGYGELIRTFDYSLADLAGLVGRSEGEVGRLLLLLDAPERATKTHTTPTTRQGAPLTAELAALGRHLSNALGLRVEMTSEGPEGAMRISFAGMEQLERLARHLSAFRTRKRPARKCRGLAA